VWQWWILVDIVTLIMMMKIIRKVKVMVMMMVVVATAALVMVFIGSGLSRGGCFGEDTLKLMRHI